MKPRHAANQDLAPAESPRRPIYQTIKTLLRARIESGELPSGARVPSEKELAEQHGVSRGQARLALRDMEMEGYLERFPGRGSFVAPEERRNPSRFARRDGRTIVLAYPILARDNGSRHIRSMVTSFTEYLQSRNYHVTYYYVGQSLDAEIRFLSQIEDSGFSGLALLLQYRAPEERQTVNRIIESRYPCVLIDRHFPDVDSDFVGTANRRAVARLTQEVIARGHRSIAYFARDLDNTVMEDRLAGYRSALESAGIAFNPRLVVVQQDGHSDMNAHLRRIFGPRTRPTALVCSDSWRAQDACESLGNLGIRFPDDLEVATIDDTVDPSQEQRPPWITAIQDGPEIGRQTAQLILDRIAEPQKCFEQRYVLPLFLFDTHEMVTPVKDAPKGGESVHSLS